MALLALSSEKLLCASPQPSVNEDIEYEYCSALSGISLPSSVTSIGDYAFDGLNMWKLELPASIKTLGSSCFGRTVCVLLPSTTHVSIKSDTFDGVKAVFVPSTLMELYPLMTNWSNYSTKLHPLGLYRDKDEFTLVTEGAAVDLGLSVKWASCNIGAESPEQYGEYYAWGETEEKSDYSWSTYKWCKGSYTTMTKYCTNSFYGTVDNKTILEPEDDAAHIKLGGSWRMPTIEEWDELLDNCFVEWTQYKGKNGRLVYGFSGNQIFLPAAGDLSVPSQNKPLKTQVRAAAPPLVGGAFDHTGPYA